MNQRRVWWIPELALTLAIFQPVFAQERTATSPTASPSIPSDSRLIRLNALDSTALYPPVVTAIASTRDGTWLVAAGDDHALRIVQLFDGQVSRTLEGHTDWVQSVVILDDNQTIVSCGKDRTLRSWSASNNWKSNVMHEADVALMAMAVDDKQGVVACGGFGPEIWIYSVREGRLVKTLRCECGDQRALAFSKNGQRLACGGRDGIVRIWDWQSDARPLEQNLHRDRIRSIGFSEDDTTISTVGEDRHFVRYHLESGSVLVDRIITGGRLLSMASIDERTLAIAGSDNTIRLIEIESGDEINRLFGHDGSVAILLRSGDQLVSGSFDTTIRTWDLTRALQRDSGHYEHPVSARFRDSGATDAVR